jgi:hypothetical protein
MFQHGAVPHIVFNNENFERLVVLHISDYIGFYRGYNAVLKIFIIDYEPKRLFPSIIMI